MEQRIVLESIGEIDETLVYNHRDATLLCPCYQALQVAHGDEVARGIVGVDEQEGRYFLIIIEGLYVLH